MSLISATDLSKYCRQWSLGKWVSKNNIWIKYHNMVDVYRIVPRAPGMLQSIEDILHVHHQKLLANCLSVWVSSLLHDNHAKIPKGRH
jgi:hypothetical protein